MASQQVHGTVPGNESTIHDEPHLEGSRITVRQIQRRVADGGPSPTDIADRYDPDLAAVSAGLTYYHMNPDEMRRVEERRAELADNAGEMTTLTPPDET